jgi:hypothetical protein
LGSGLVGLDALICYCQQISHGFCLLVGDLLYSHDVCDPIMEGIDDLNVFDVKNSIPGIAKTFQVISKAFIILLLDGLQSFGSRWPLICALEIADEHGIELVPIVDGSFGYVDEP